MSNIAIQDVSDTAFMVASYRAMETERSDALFRDPLAAKLSGAHGEKIIKNLPRSAAFGKWIVAIRTCIIDAFIEAAIADGVDTVLNLGAGLDTRPYRMRLPQSLRWIEVDYPKIVELKQSRLADETPRCQLERIKLDLADIAARRQLFSRIASESGKVLVLTEGVLPYLSTEEVARLADDLKAQGVFRYWVADYLSPQAMQWRKRMEHKLKMQNAPFRFEPQDWSAFFGGHGWKAKDTRYIAEEAERLNRPLKPPFFLLVRAIFARLFLGKSQKEAFRKSAAYVLLEAS